MTKVTKFPEQVSHKWMTLNAIKSGNKFILEERIQQHKSRQVVECALVVLVATLLVGAYVTFFLPWFPLPMEYAGAGLATTLIGMALVLYAFATRGHAMQVGFDREKKQVWICKINAQGHARITTYMPKKDVQSVYIRRPSSQGKDAALMARISGKAMPAVILRGPLSDITAAHDLLCAELRSDGIKPARVLPASRRRRKPHGALKALTA